MGCFSVSCGASALSMMDDPAVLVPLIPAGYGPERDPGGFRFSGSNLVSNDGEQTLFVPLTLPLFGKVDSYGRLEEIERDLNVEAIEEYFGESIDDWARTIAYGYGDVDRRATLGEAPEPYDGPEVPAERKNWLVHSAGMFLHRGVYDLLSGREKLKSPSGLEQEVAKASFGFSPHLMKVLGFEKVGDESEFMKSRLDHPKCPGLLVELRQVGGTGWCCDALAGGPKGRKEIYQVDDLVRHMEKAYKFQVSDDAQELLEESIYASRTRDSIEEFREFRARRAGAKPADADGMRYIERMGLDRIQKEIFWENDSYSTGRHLLSFWTELYGSRLGEKGIQKLVVELKHLGAGFFATNRLYMPTFAGPQCGEHEASRALYRKSLDIVRAKIKELEVC